MWKTSDMLMELLVQCVVSLMPTKWIATALWGTKIITWFRKWTPDPTIDFVTSTRFSAVFGLLLCLHKQAGKSEQQVYPKCLHYTNMTAWLTKHPETPAKQSPLSRNTWLKCHNDAKREGQKSVQAGCRPCTSTFSKTTKTGSACSFIQRRSHWMHE